MRDHRIEMDPVVTKTAPSAQFLDHAQTLPNHRHTVKDYFPMSVIFPYADEIAWEH
jgi:hypothetical protein